MIYKRFAGLEPVADICGKITALTNQVDDPALTEVIAHIVRPSAPHYHQFTSEHYVVLRGSGIMMIKDETQMLNQYDTVVIPRRHVHMFVPLEEAWILATTHPAWSEHDQFELHDNKSEVGYFIKREQALLIDDLLRRGNLGFSEDMDGAHIYELEEERRRLVATKGWTGMSIEELRGQFV